MITVWGRIYPNLKLIQDKHNYNHAIRQYKFSYLIKQCF